MRNRSITMNPLMKPEMMAATRLTREGRLNEALSVLMGSLGSSKFEATAPRSAPGHATTTVRLLPPRTGSDGAPKSTAERFADGQTDRRNTQNSRSFGALLDQMRQLGSAPAGLQGLGARKPTPVPDGARFEERTYANAAGARTYKLFVPSGYAGQAVPLLVMLHGCKQSPDDFAAGTRMNELAEEQNFLVAYPEQSTSANPSKCWNWFKAPDQERGQGEPSLIAGITREIMSEFEVDSTRVAIAGLSAGGAAAAIMGAAYPDLFDAVGVHSGLACGSATDMPSAFAAMRAGAPGLTRRSGVRTIVFHGDRDVTVNSVNGDQVIAQSKSTANLQVSVSQGQTPGGARYSRSVHTHGSGEEVLEQWVVHGLGHAWSGGSPAGSYTDPRGPDASREMVRFFFRMPTSRDPADSA
jgi:poly(hydroxyalkanoate) depolymerase family esterase